MASMDPLAEALALAELLNPRDEVVIAGDPPAWADIRAGIPAWHPRNDSDDGDGGDTGGDGGGGDTGDGDGDGDDDDDDDGADSSDNDPVFLKRQSRKHERRAKAELKKRQALETRLRELEAAGQTDQETAIAKARDEAKAEALTEGQKERRNDRLEVAVTRQAARTFRDVDDALVHIKHAIDDGELDADEIFDDAGKVQAAALKTALDDLLKSKPHLKAGGTAAGRPGGSADGGKGSGSGKGPDDMSVEEHHAAIRRHKK